MLLSVIVLLVIFLTLTATVLNRINLKSSEQALRENLNTQLYALLSAADVELNNKKLYFVMPSSQLSVLLGQANSGLYAQVTNQNQDVLWQSDSY